MWRQNSLYNKRIINKIIQERKYMKEIIRILIFASSILFCSCRENPSTNSTDFVFTSEEVFRSIF